MGPAHTVAVVGGACAGSVVAEHLAERGCQVVVFEQNPRPYGKIEDGLPRWHDKQRNMEYGKINERLDRPNVHYVPNVRFGQEIGLEQLLDEWGFSALVLANGAWKDRELAVPGAVESLGKGLIYQNEFIYWFNHFHEEGYSGPTFEIKDEALCVGGGLASIDVVKVIQLELYGRALRERGFDVDVYHLEHKGIPKVCAEHGIDDPQSLGVRGVTLVYRRRVEDMPLASAPPGASEKIKARLPTTRRKILEKAQSKFLFRMMTQRVSNAVVMEDGQLTGLEVLETKLEDGRVKPVPGSEHVIPTSMIVSSIGSIPEPLQGVQMKGAYYEFKDWDTGEYAPRKGVFGAGNVVTGQGNIKASLEHGRFVAGHLAEVYLGLREGDLSEGTARGEAKAAATGEAVAEHLETVPKKTPAELESLLARVGELQRARGYTGYAEWIAAKTPKVAE
jgi:NADPH-dependent glutamate synthase beta subunit-like oxidoreductase